MGLHPWYIEHVGTLHQQLDLFDEQLATTRFVGEVGLDFSKQRASSAEKQIEAFTHIVSLCAQEGDKLLSIHAIKSAKEVLDALESSGAITSCQCIFHWFSGPSDQLQRAIKAGCYFSVGPFMANSRRGHEYIKQIPAGQLLLETDYPSTKDGVTYDSLTMEPRVDLSFSQINNALSIAANVVTETKNVDALLEIDDTTRQLLAS